MIRIPRGITALVGALLLMLLAALAWRGCHPGPAPSPLVPPDTAPAAAWRARTDSLVHELAVAQGDAAGLRGRLAALASRLRGVQARSLAPETVYDTLIRIDRDTVLLRVAADSRGELHADAAVPADSGRVRPVIIGGASVADCDDGWSLQGESLICDRSALGHLEVGPELAGVLELQDGWRRFLPRVYAAWTPSYRSTLSITAAYSPIDQRAEIRVRRGWRLR